MDHTHLYCIVPGGGIEESTYHWIPSRKGFFINVLVELTGFDILICPRCRKDHLVVKEIIPPTGHSPPHIVIFAT